MSTQSRVNFSLSSAVTHCLKFSEWMFYVGCLGKTETWKEVGKLLPQSTFARVKQFGQRKTPAARQPMEAIETSEPCYRELYSWVTLGHCPH